MKKIMVYLQLAAVFCAALILSIPVTSALSIRVFMPGGQAPSQETTYAISSKIEKNVSVGREQNDIRWENVWVKVSVVGKDIDYEITRIYLYLCKDQGPAECSSGMPIEAKSHLSGERASFKWNDVSAKGVANFMTLVEMKHGGKAVWAGFFDTIERNDTGTFNFAERKLDSIDVYAKSAINALWVKNYIDEYMMAPAEWIDRAVLGGKDAFYTLSANKTGLDAAKLSSSSTAGSEVNAFPDEYTFIFGKDVTHYPFTFLLAPPVSCPDTQCDLALGETPANCCLDCGCAGGQDCTANTDYPFGLCHTCGDGLHDAVENWTNCCADAGCAAAGAGFYCDKTITPPYGKCVNASCGKDGCESTENSVNCAKDCHATPGKTCAESYHDASYYYDTGKKDCVKAVCGPPSNTCEPLGGENYQTCCIDSKGSDPCQCPAGTYCNNQTDASGACMPSSCGNENCEFDETRGKDNACCMDCDDCPSGMTCEKNVCHECGNGKHEAGPETEQTCCQDTGCSVAGDYCSESGSCKPSPGMGISVMLSPSNKADCNQEDAAASIRAIISLTDRPEKFGKFTSASYEIAGTGVQKSMSCTESSVYYECSIPLTGSDIFQGCFEAGPKDVNITASFTYYQNTTTKVPSAAALSRNVAIDVIDARTRSCDLDGECDTDYDENEGNCCYDCNCPSGEFCVAGTCSTEPSITIDAHDAEGDAADCQTGSGKVSFKAYVTAKPDSDDEAFSFKTASWVINYDYVKDGTTYYRTGSTSNMTGFRCTPIKALDTDIYTGEIDCEIPVSVFPLCQHGDGPIGTLQQDKELEFSVAVLGGGLGDKHKNGLRVSDTFTVDYYKGLPGCDGESACVEADGENEATCCKDCGCADSATVCETYADDGVSCEEYAKRFCSVDTGKCDDEGNVRLVLQMDDEEIDCTDPNGFVTFTASVIPGPMGMKNPPLSGMILHVTGKDDGMDYHYSYQSNMKCAAGESLQEMECSIKKADFRPCWDTGPKVATLSAEASYVPAGEGRARDIALQSAPVEFTVTAPMQRGCDQSGGCEWDEGELQNGCCTDCGCSKDTADGSEMICARKFGAAPDYGCVKKDDVKMTITDVTDEVDCSKYMSNDLVIKLRIDNMPYNNEGIEWSLLMDKDGDGTSETYAKKLSCNSETGSENEITCETNTMTFPELCYHGCIDEPGGCPATVPDQERHLTLSGKIHHFEATTNGGEIKDDVSVSSAFSVDAINLLPSCGAYGGDARCNKDSGETANNCCSDCPCPEGQVCTNSGGCVDIPEVTLDIQPDSQTVTCIQSMTGYEIKLGRIGATGYECVFPSGEKYQDSHTFRAVIRNMPYIPDIDDPFNPYVPFVYYYLDKNYEKAYTDITKEEGSWNLIWSPGSVVSEDGGIDTTHTMEIHIDMTAGNRHINVNDNVKLTYKKVETEDLVSAENNLNRIRSLVWTLAITLGVISLWLGLCTGCGDGKSADSLRQIGTQLGYIAVAIAGVSKLFELDSGFIYTVLGIVTGTYAAGAVLGGVLLGNPATTALCTANKRLTCPGMKLISYGVGVTALVSILVYVNILKGRLESVKDLAGKKTGEDISEYYKPGSVDLGI